MAEEAIKLGGKRKSTFMDKVKEIYRLFKKHEFHIAGLRSFGKVLTDENFAEKRGHAEALAADPERLATTRAEVAAKIANCRTVLLRAVRDHARRSGC